jgi:hypothetical protein
MNNGHCVEVAEPSGGLIRVRDSKNPGGRILDFTEAEWNAFMADVRHGGFERATGLRGNKK